MVNVGVGGGCWMVAGEMKDLHSGYVLEINKLLVTVRSMARHGGG